MVKANESMSIKQAAVRLSVHPATIRRMIERGKLTGFRVGRIWRIREEDLARFVSQSRGEK